MKNLYNIDDWTDNCHLRLGEILIESGKIDLIHLAMVLDIQRFKKMPIGEILISMKILSKEDLNQALYIQNEIKKRCNNA